MTQNSSTQIVYIINSLYIGGAEIGMTRLLDGLDSGEYDVTVISLDGNGEELNDQIPSWVRVLDLRLKSGIDFSMLREFWSAIQLADVIVGSLFHSVVIARAAGLFNRNAIIVTWQHTEQFKSGLRRCVFGKTNRFSEVVLADSQPVAEMLRSSFNVDEELIHTVPIAGINLNEFSQVAHEGSSAVTVGSVGRISRPKNYSTLLDVAEKLSEQNFEFEIAGDGELLEKLMEKTHQRGIPNVTFHGEITDVPDFLATLDIYFQPSRWEGLCITVLEAMAAGLPIVGSDVGGIGRNVDHGVNGFLYEPDDVQGFVSGIERLASDPKKRGEFGKNGRTLVEEQFTQEVLVDEFETAIRKASE